MYDVRFVHVRKSLVYMNLILNSMHEYFEYYYLIFCKRPPRCSTVIHFINILQEKKSFEKLKTYAAGKSLNSFNGHVGIKLGQFVHSERISHHMSYSSSTEKKKLA